MTNIKPGVGTGRVRYRDSRGTRNVVLDVDGSCVTLFNGRTPTSDFVFHDQTDAVSAAQALLDQVPTGFHPYQVAGCTFAFE